MNVLIADDHATNRKLLRALLEAERVNVFDAVDGVEALAVLEHEQVDAVISDILMPRMDGYRFCYEVRSNKYLCHLPFIFYTSTYTSPSDEKLSLELGADRFIRKPASPTVLIEALHDAMKSTRRAPKPIEPPQELNLMKEYTERLVEKLEEKNLDLTQANDQLRVTTDELAGKFKELEKLNEKLEREIVERKSAQETLEKLRQHHEFLALRKGCGSP